MKKLSEDEKKILEENKDGENELDEKWEYFIELP
jgi:hypothetical protein